MQSFYQKETKSFTAEIKVDGAIRDISGDSVTCIFKSDKSDTDVEAAITATADVSSQGASGIADFAIPKEDTDVTPGTYYWEIKWRYGDTEKIIASSTVKIKERVYD